MPDNESFLGPQRAKVDEFFYQRDRELVERMRSEAEAAAGVRQLAAVTGIVDDGLLRDLQRQGFSPQTVKLLEVAPLVLVAWSDGSVTPQEKQAISTLARLQGLGEDSASYGQLAGWLETPPSDEFFRLTLRAVRAALAPLPAEEREKKERELLSRCHEVAKATAGFLRARISTAERRAIRRVAEQIGCARDVVQGIEAGKLA